MDGVIQKAGIAVSKNMAQRKLDRSDMAFLRGCNSYE
jgi:hypothetical protein